MEKLNNTASELTAIFAMDQKDGIGKNGMLPWHYPKDLIHFKNITNKGTVIMGYNTLLSLPNKKPLKNRSNVVLTRNKDKCKDSYQEYNNNPGLLVFKSEEEIIADLKAHNIDNAFVIGGKQVFDLLLPFCKHMWLTIIKKDYDCDVKMDKKYLEERFVIDRAEYEDDEIQIGYYDLKK